MERHGWMLAVVLAIVSCGESQPTAAVCTRPDEGNACPEATNAARIAGEDEAWNVVLHTTVSEPLEYADGGVQCVLTQTTCVVEECTYARSPDFPSGYGWFLLVGGDALLLGPGEDSAERAIAECRGYWGR